MAVVSNRWLCVSDSEKEMKTGKVWLSCLIDICVSDSKKEMKTGKVWLLCPIDGCV